MIQKSLCFLVACVLSCAGCGGPNFGTPTKVTGKVSVSGQPPKDVRLIMQANDGKLPADKRFATATLEADGAFEIEKVFPAEYTVSLESALPPPADPGSAAAVPNAYLPLDQNGSPKSLTAKVSTETHEFTFDF